MNETVTHLLPSASAQHSGGPALRAGKYFVDTYNLTPSLHRFWNATGVMAGLFVGRKLMDWMVGQEISGKPVDPEEVPLVLRPLHGCLAYNHFSDDPKDRWMKVVDKVIPAVLGAYGGYQGSEFFFNGGNWGAPSRFGTITEAMKDPGKITLEAAEDAISMSQSRPWRAMSGVASMFGSSSGFGLIPGPWNYGTTLGMSFLAAPRNKVIFPGLGKWLTNTQSVDYPYGPPELLKRMVAYATHNPDRAPQQLEKMGKAILGAWFGESATPQRVKMFVNEVHAVRDKFFREGGIPENLKKECEAELTKVFRGIGFESTLKKIGLNPLEAQIGEHGLMSNIARLMGKDEEVRKHMLAYRKSYLMRNPGEAAAAAKIALPYRESSAAPAIAVLGAGGAALALAKPNNHEFLDQEEKIKALGNTRSGDGAKDEADKPSHQHGQSFSTGSGISGKPLDVLEWLTDGFNSQETLGRHRTMCAGGLTVGGLAGMVLANALTGLTLAGTPIEKSKINKLLQPFYKKLSYNPHSDNPRDRWAMVAHYLIPAVTSAYGVVTASNIFFEDRREKGKTAEFIDDYDDKAGMIQAGPWTGLTALTSVIATPSGNVFLPFPFPNYGTALGTRFSLMSGREVIMPGMGRFWTNNRSRYPVGSAKLVNHMIKYAVNNPDRDPVQLDEMAYGILAPWFKDVTAEQVNQFVDQLHEVRDKFLKEGGIPEEYKKKCEKELIAHFRGAGLEETLKSIGLDPEKAALGQNGFAGAVANFLGAKKDLEAMQKEYLDKYRKRQHAKQEKQDSPEPYKAGDEKTFAARVEQQKLKKDAAEPNLQLGA